MLYLNHNNISDIGARELVSAITKLKQLETLALFIYSNQVSEKIKLKLKSQMQTELQSTKFLESWEQPGCIGGCWFDGKH